MFPLGKLFVKSPLASVTVLMERVVECSRSVEPLIEALAEGNHDRVAEIAREVSVLEGKADDAKNMVRSRMPTRLFLPVARRDVLKLVSQIDAVADAAEDVAVLLTFRKMDVHPDMRAPLKLFTTRCIETVETAQTLVDQLDALLAAGFRGHAAEAAQLTIQDLAKREHESDKLQDQLVKIVFQLEDELGPISVMMWLKILEEIGDMSNHAENVGDLFRLFTAR